MLNLAHAVGPEVGFSPFGPVLDVCQNAGLHKARLFGSELIASLRIKLGGAGMGYCGQRKAGQHGTQNSNSGFTHHHVS